MRQQPIPLLFFFKSKFRPDQHPRDIKGRFRSSDDALPALPDPTHAHWSLLPSGRDDRFYLSAFMREFGVNWNETAILTDKVPYRRLVSKELFMDHKTGRFKIEKNGRAVYVKYIAEAIKNPDEIWLSSGGHGDEALHCLARFSVRGNVLNIVAVFRQKSVDAWVGWSGYQTRTPEQFSSKRVGHRIYAKGN